MTMSKADILIGTVLAIGGVALAPTAFKYFGGKLHQGYLMEAQSNIGRNLELSEASIASGDRSANAYVENATHLIENIATGIHSKDDLKVVDQQRLNSTIQTLETSPRLTAEQRETLGTAKRTLEADTLTYGS